MLNNSQNFFRKSNSNNPQSDRMNFQRFPINGNNLNHYNYNYNYNCNNRSNEPGDLTEHYCETCDRGFKNAQLLQTHIAEHQKCGIDGCKFVGHPKVVTKHIQMQHSTGLFNRIKNLETPEDISNWIKERKKNYPSKENIEKQKVQQKEQFDRGEKIRERRSKFNNNQNSKFNHRDKRNNNKNTHRRNGLWTNKDEIHVKKDFKRKIDANLHPEDSDAEECYCGVRAFKGTSELDRYDMLNEDVPLPRDDIDIEDDEWQEETVNVPKEESITMCKALSSLVAAYQSFSEDEDTAEVTDVKKPNTAIIKQVVEPKQFVPDDSEDSGPEVAAIEKSDSRVENLVEMEENGIKDSTDHNPNKKQGRKRKYCDKDMKSNPETNKKVLAPNRQMLNTFQKQLQYYKERPSTLLEKLLSKEIRHERNVMLQCINYIVKNNFFDSLKKD